MTVFQFLFNPLLLFNCTEYLMVNRNGDNGTSLWLCLYLSSSLSSFFLSSAFLWFFRSGQIWRNFFFIASERGEVLVETNNLRPNTFPTQVLCQSAELLPSLRRLLSSKSSRRRLQGIYGNSRSQNNLVTMCPLGTGSQTWIVTRNTYEGL